MTGLTEIIFLQPEDLCTMERAKGTPRKVKCYVPEAPFFGKDFSRKQPPTSTLQRPAEAHPAMEGWGRSTMCEDITCIAFTSMSLKEKQNLLLFLWMFTPAGKAVAGWQNVPRN